MTTAVSSEKTILRQLTKVHARRYARHPLFLVGFIACVGFVLADMFVDSSGFGPDRDFATTVFWPSFWIGVFGIIVAYRLTRTEERALDLLPSAPTSPTVRTLALCRACLVPAAAGVAILAVTLIGWQFKTPTLLPEWQSAMPTAEFWAWMVGGIVVSSLGGPLLGVAVGRWWGFPGAGVAAAVIVAFAVFLATNYSGAPGDNDLAKMIERSDSISGRIVGSVIPFTNWLLAEYDLEDPVAPAILPYVMRAGSAVGHLFYMLSLCGLAVWAAVMKDAEGSERALWRRRGWILAVVALASLSWAVLG